ncbi:Protein of unknown function [Paenibacillus sp. cl141a]|nr:Protein of unknown function [Paenibacillus sp. cl141a]
MTTSYAWAWARVHAPYLSYAYGRMALTDYIGQTVFPVGIQRFMLNTTPTTYVVSSLVSLGIVFFQIITSQLSMRWFQYGPWNGCGDAVPIGPSCRFANKQETYRSPVC